ncbi:hypothetical protein, partial [Pseudomonas chlororaphis]
MVSPWARLEVVALDGGKLVPVLGVLIATSLAGPQSFHCALLMDLSSASLLPPRWPPGDLSASIAVLPGLPTMKIVSFNINGLRAR